MRNLFKGPLSFLLIFFPITLTLEYLHASSVLVFFCAALAIIPLAALLSTATEELARITGSTIGGLLNATFGNAPEIIICIVILMSGHVEMVKASILGAIIANLLLALGLAFFLGGLRHSVQEFSHSSTSMQSSMLMIGLTGMIAPGLVNALLGKQAPEISGTVSVGVSIILLVTYLLSLYYMIGTHPALFSDGGTEHDEEHGAPPSAKSAILLLLVASGLIAFMSEILVGAVEGAALALGMTEVFVGAIVLAIVGGAAESSSAIVMARKNRMNLAVQIALGSSLQIAIMVFPLLVLVSYFISPTPLNLGLNGPGALMLLLSILIASMVVSEGKSTWYKGFQLVATYLIIALLIYFIPGSSPQTVVQPQITIIGQK